MSLGETRTLLRCKGPGKWAPPEEVTGIREPSPTIIEAGRDDVG
jgi:hypothetical protein